MSSLVLKDSVFVLPSKGFLYENGCSEVRLKVMTANEVKVIAGARGTGFNILNGILRRLVIDPPMPLEEFLSSDRLAMLYAIRVLAFGPTFGVNLQCRNCAFQWREEIDIMKLDIKYADESVSEPFTTTIDGEEVQFILPRGKFEKIAESMTARIARNKALSEEGDPYNLYLLAQCLKKWGDREFSNFHDAYKFLCSLPAWKWWEFVDIVEETDFGLPRRIEIICPNCSYVDEVPLPMSAEFFRPVRRGSKQH